MTFSFLLNLGSLLTTQRISIDFKDISTLKIPDVTPKEEVGPGDILEKDDECLLDEIEKCLESSESSENRLVIGDFNLPKMDWSNMRFDQKPKGLSFGSKSTKANSLSLNELTFHVRAGKEENKLDANGQWLQVLLGSLEGKNQDLDTPFYYFPEEAGYAVPGHHFTTGTDGIKKFTAEYAFKRSENDDTAKIEVETAIKSTWLVFCTNRSYILSSWSGVRFGNESAPVQFQPGNWDTDIQTPNIEKAVYDGLLGRLELIISVTEVKARLFMRILGPVLKDSTQEMRGIVLKYDTYTYAEGGKYVFSVKNAKLSEAQAAQLNFVEKALRDEDFFALTTFFQEEENNVYSYKAMAFQCGELLLFAS
ncbi:hypothetical protein Ciccas_006950 [Cichlidogyrus casuarinus]|uniref:Uncharacterized protein n=1 Tax=Cichlidogyrus casuarinus TaxID=1844966 RepID=A0ABD2Q495_9PLAT